MTNETEQAELLPCPFCGRKPNFFLYGEYTATISCECDIAPDVTATGTPKARQRAISIWNTRTPDLTLLDVEDSKSLNNRLLHALHSQLESPEMEERFRGAALKAVSGRTYSEHNKDEWAAHVAQAIRAEIKEALGGSHE